MRWFEQREADGQTDWQRSLLALAAAYASVTWALSRLAGRPVDWNAPGARSQTLGLMMLGLLFLLIGWFADRLRGPYAPIWFRHEGLRDLRFPFDFGCALLVIHLAVTLSTSLRRLAPVLNERLYDSPLWRLDARLHLGFPPAFHLSELASQLSLLPLVDQLHLVLGPVEIALPALFLVSTRLRPERGRFLFAYCLAAILVSSFWLIWPSLGPVMYRPTEFSSIEQAPIAHMLQQTALEGYVALRGDPGGRSGAEQAGLAAFPDLELAGLALAAIAASRGRWLAWGLWVLTGLAFVKSLALGWHYAVDGYVALLVAWGAWQVARRSIPRLAA